MPPELLSSIGRGATPTPVDYRQIKLEHIAGAAAPISSPINIMIDYSKIPDLFQRQIGACQNHAFTEILMHRELRLKGAVTLLSPRFPYTMSKLEDGITDLTNQATYSVSPFKIGVKYGVATDAIVPNDTTLAFNDYIYHRTVGNMPAEAFTDANNHRIPGYVQVGSENAVTAAQLAQALTQEPDGVLIQIALGTEWYSDVHGTLTWAGSSILPIRKCTAPIDNHDVTLIGLETEVSTGRIKAHFRNHWSLAWAAPYDDNGWFYLDEHTIVEAWIPSEIPAALLAIVQSLPSQATFSHSWTTPLSPGMTSADVQALQIALKIIGVFPFNQPVSNYFGSITGAAVRQWQIQENIATLEQINAAGGAVGPKSLAILNKMFAHK